MSAYGVTIVRDDDLPDDVEWMFVKTTGRGLLLCLGESSAGSSRVLAEAWSAFQVIHAARPVDLIAV